MTSFVPNPLHPALIHFPIAFLLAGAVFAVVAVFRRAYGLPLLAAVLLSLGAVGAWVSIETGESEGERLEKRSPQARALLEAHEDWAKGTLAVASAAAVFALVSLGLMRAPRAARVAGLIAALAALGAGYAVYQTGRRGGELVYQHAAGIRSSPPVPVSAPGSPEVGRN